MPTVHYDFCPAIYSVAFQCHQPKRQSKRFVLNFRDVLYRLLHARSNLYELD